MKIAMLAFVPVFVLACGDAPKTETARPREDPPVTDPEPTPEPDAGKAQPDAAAMVCADSEETYAAARETSNVLFLLDRSGSMQIKLTGNDTRWSATKRGLEDLLASLPSTTRAGAMMFPQGDAPITCCGIDPQLNDVKCHCATGELPGTTARCNTSTYRMPVGVSMLDTTHVNAIESYVSSSDTEFYWGTPLAPALTAAISSMQALPMNGPKSVILLTDGYPTSCDTTGDPTANDIQRVVTAASTGAGNVRTFVMGVIDGTKGARADYLSAIAKAGGTARAPGCDATNDCHYALNAATFAHDIRAAFDAIALQAFDCTFAFPTPKPGAVHDLSKVTVLVKTANGTITLARDTSHQSGWDYLSGQTQFQLYGQACTALKTDAQAKVDVVVGCKNAGQ